VIDATDLRTLNNVAGLIDPAILTQAYDNDLLEQAQPSPPVPKRRPARLRRLVPDAQLLRRRAAGQPLRALARDYHIAHTTLSRYFARPEVKQQLRQTLAQLRAQQRALPPAAPPSSRINSRAENQ
jgi:hypothetical protein